MARTLFRPSTALKDYLGLVARLPRLTPEQQDSLASELTAGEALAGLALTESFLALVVAEATLHRGLGLRFEALIAAGNRGLAEALRQTGGRLQWRVRRCVRRSLREALARAAAQGRA